MISASSKNAACRFLFDNVFLLFFCVCMRVCVFLSVNKIKGIFNGSQGGKKKIEIVRITLQLGSYFIFQFFSFKPRPLWEPDQNKQHALLIASRPCNCFNVLFEEGSIIFWLFAHQSTAPQLWPDARIETVNISRTGKATETEKGAAVLVPAGIAADGSTRGYRQLHLHATQRGDVALRGTRGISAEGVNSEGPKVLSSMDRCDKPMPHSIIISGCIEGLNH